MLIMLCRCDGEGYGESGHKLWEYDKHCTYFYGLSGDLVKTINQILRDRIYLEEGTHFTDTNAYYQKSEQYVIKIRHSKKSCWMNEWVMKNFLFFYGREDALERKCSLHSELLK